MKEDYNLYAVPVLLNGDSYNLQVVYDFNTEEWSILGPVRALMTAVWPIRNCGFWRRAMS